MLSTAATLDPPQDYLNQGRMISLLHISKKASGTVEHLETFGYCLIGDAFPVSQVDVISKLKI